MNSYGSTHESITSNVELNELIKIIFGTNDLKNLDYDKVKFKKIIILADADVDGSHIVALLTSFFEGHCPGLIERGYVYIGLSPLYRITVKGKYKYFRNDEAYNKYKAEYLKTQYTIASEELTMDKIVSKMEEFMFKLSYIKTNYSVNNDIISSFMHNENIEDAKDEIKEMKLSVEGNHIEGLTDDIWVDIDLTDEFLSKIEELKNVMEGCHTIAFEDKNEGECYECDIIDLVELLEGSFKFSRYRFKGLGEMPAQELEVTTLNVNNRDLIQLKLNDKEAANELNKLFFGGNTNKRKEFIQEHLL